jgi:AcrR family transcriptional regulator
MSRPKNADGQRTRRALLDAALDLFAEKGFFGTSLRDVATAVGVRESAIYNYFPSKDALFEALIVATREEKTERLAALATAPWADGRAALEEFTVAILEDYALPRQQQLFRILMSDGIRLAKNGRLNLLERMGNDGGGPVHDVLRRLIREGLVRDGDLTTLVIAFVSPLILWRHVRAINGDAPMVQNPEQFAREHVDQFLRGAGLHAAGAAAVSRRRSRIAAARRRPVARPRHLS